MTKLSHELGTEEAPIVSIVADALRNALNNLPNNQEIDDAFKQGKDVDAVVREASSIDLEINTLQIVRQLGFVAGHLEKIGDEK